MQTTGRNAVTQRVVAPTARFSRCASHTPICSGSPSPSSVTLCVLERVQNTQCLVGGRGYETGCVYRWFHPRLRLAHGIGLCPAGHRGALDCALCHAMLLLFAARARRGIGLLLTSSSPDRPEGPGVCIAPMGCCNRLPWGGSGGAGGCDWGDGGGGVDTWGGGGCGSSGHCYWTG